MLGYRLHAVVPLPYVEAVRARFGPEGQRALLEDVRGRIAALGFRNPRLVIQDPTDNAYLTAVVDAPLSSAASDGVIRVRTVEPVDVPPEAQPCTDARLDPGLSADECAALKLALERDRDPRHLDGFARSMEPVFPIASSLLLARRRTILHDPPENTPPTSAAEILKRRRAFEAYAARNRIPLDLAREEARRAAILFSDGQEVTTAPEVYALARTVVRSNADRRRVVDREALRTAAPYDGREDYLSPSAVKLALSAGKPIISGVANRAQIGAVNRRLGDVRSPDERVLALRAHSSMERSYRALDRGRWVRWYLRNAGAGLP